MTPSTMVTADRKHTPSIWRGSAGCTTTADELDAVAASALALDGDVRGRLTDPATVLHDLVAWAYVRSTDGSHVLLVRHRRLDRWMPPGGRVDAGEMPIDAAVRELGEETGITVRPAPDQPAALVDVVDHALPDGSIAASFGAAYAFTADMTHPLRPEAGQPAAWWPLGSPPSDVSERHWARLQDHLLSR